ncbi:MULTISPECIES: phage tail tape measure protein [Streptomyces]|uniref:Transglycosylase SLT domain-containing protein n=3 Tax=Streptomyces rimosus TaxID=1927 RepID=L8EYP2_STRR1|nr:MULTISPECIES: phage tail tape measure protein [Streptomyces]MYT47280.1 transglycosylase SLT domain-containing protein [Streptomyces sp. SID5471]KEF04613.1 hypothetical protein DF17_22235 [Streptomyces rimosus]KUJ29402.1 hypothetical protein ADK46_29190 [Streptomyces rimosus subsp. rimosus]QDA06301.1 replication protein [Streptomyces rimosus]QEV77577.1 replication protein [Streptomyces rimosus]
MPSVGYATLQIIPSVRGIGDELRRQLVGPSADAGQEAGESAGGGLSDKLKKGAAAAGVAAGAILVKGLVDAIGQADVTSKLQAQLGTSNKVASAQGKLAGKLYSSGVTGSFEEAADAIRSVVSAGLAPPNATNAQLQSMATKASDVAGTFGEELGGVTNAVAQLMRTGLVKNANEAFDLITAGFQSGANKAEDLLDTINEYSTQFRRLGLDGPTAIGLLTQGLKAGARDADQVADGIGQFGERALAGGTAVDEAFESIGLSSSDMAAKIGKGGASAAGALQQTLDAMRGTKDEQVKLNAAAALFGDPGNVMGAALYALNPASAAAASGMNKTAGAAGRLGNTLRSGPAYELQVFARTLQQSLVDFLGGKVLPVLGQVGAWVNANVLPPLSGLASIVGAVLVPVLTGLWNVGTGVVGWLQSMGTWLIPIGIAVTGLTVAITAQRIAVALTTAVFSVYRAAILGWAAVQRGAIVVQAAFNAVMNANPIILIITAILALGAAVVVAYQKVGWFRTAVQTAWAGIQTAALWAWTNVLQPMFAAFRAGLAAIGAAASWLWTTILAPVFSFIGTAARILATIIAFVVAGPIILAVRAIGAIFSWLWVNVISPVVGWIGARVSWLNTNIIQPNILAIRLAVSAVGAGFSWLWRSIIQPVLGWIASKAIWLWTFGIKPSFGLLRQGLDAVGGAFSWLWRSIVQPVLGWIGDKAGWLWRNAIKPAFDLIGRGVAAVGRSFEDAKNFIGRAWGQLESIAKKPVRFIIGTVYNKGIVPTWNLIAGAFGAPEIKAMDIRGWARGGPVRGPGTERSDSVPAWLSNNEHVWTGKEVRGAGGHGAVMGLRRLASSGRLNLKGGLPAFKDGGGLFGWIGSAASTLKGWGSAAWDKVKSAASWLGETIEASARAGVKNIVDPLLAKLPGADTGFGKMIRRMPTKIVDAIFGYSKKADEKGAAVGAAAAGPGALGKWIAQAMRITHVPASWAGPLRTLIMRESGGNPKAINLWDSNAKAGYPSQGLMQTIPQTFAAYRLKSLPNDITHPIANIVAGIRYILSRYGSIFKVQQAVGSTPKGYASGGRPRAGELAWVGERGAELVRFGSGGATVYDHRTSMSMAAGLGARGFAKGTPAARARSEVGGDLAKFTKSLTGSAASIASATKELAKDLAAAGGAGKRLAANTNRTSASLQALAKQRDALSSTISKAKAAAADQSKVASDYLGLGQIGEVKTIGDVIGRLQERQAAVKSREQDFAALSKKGLSKSAITQLSALGLDSPLASILAGASKTDLALFDKLLAQSGGLATSYGNTVADAMYDSGKQASKGFLTGLLGQQKLLQSAMNTMGAALVRGIKSALKIKSPSRVMRDEVGAQVGAGLVAGMDGTTPAVAAAAARMADTAAGAGWRSPEVGSAAGSGSGLPREVVLSGPLYLEGGEFAGIVRGVVREEQDALVMQAGAGRRS